MATKFNATTTWSLKGFCQSHNIPMKAGSFTVRTFASGKKGFLAITEDGEEIGGVVSSKDFKFSEGKISLMENGEFMLHKAGEASIKEVESVF